MESLKQMKECLTAKVESQIYGNLDSVNTKELGEAIDMIKDLAEAIYYCTITESMEEGAEEKERMSNHQGSMYYSPRRPKPEPWPIEYYDPRYKDRYAPITYPKEHGKKGEYDYREVSDHVYRNGMMMHDPYEGKSGERRKMYMEGKGKHDKAHQMQELEAYMQELAQDMSEMVEDASPEEKMLLQQKISTLASKIK